MTDDRRCPECEGVGWVTYGAHSTDSEPCRTCAGVGRLTQEPTDSMVDDEGRRMTPWPEHLPRGWT